MKQRLVQSQFWIAHTELPRAVGHPFYERLNRLLEERGFDQFIERQCERFYVETMGRPALTPGVAGGERAAEGQDRGH